MTLNQLIKNAIYQRGEWIRKLMDTESRDIDKECGHPENITIQDYKKAFKRGDIAARIIEVYPQETWQTDPIVYETEENEETVFETVWKDLNKKHNFYSVLQRVDILSGIGKFGIILIGINDNLTLDKPVRGIAEDGSTTETPGTEMTKIIYLRTFDQESVKVKKVQKDTKNPRYGQPVLYSLSIKSSTTDDANDGSVIESSTDVDVHWTRVIHICDNRTDSDIYGMPRLERVWNRLVDLKKTMGGSGEMFWRGGFPGLSIETTPAAAGEEIDFDKEATRKEIEEYQKGFKRYLALVGMTAKSLAPQIADPTNHMNAQIRMIAIAWSVPWRILMGAELGQLASEQDITAWNKRISRRQESYVTPYVILPFAQRLQNMGVLPKTGENGIFVQWQDTHTVSATDKATVAEKITNAITKYVQGGGDLVVDPFHFLTLVLSYTDEEANAIIEKVGDALQKDREMKEMQAELAMEEGEASLEVTKAGGAGNGNANGDKTPAKNKPVKAAPSK